MEWWSFLVVIPVVAIVMGIGSEMWKSFLHHRERALEIKAASQNSANGGVLEQIEALREEVARLRDTSTQYDISIQHTLEDLQDRMNAFESRNRTAIAPPSAESEQQATVATRSA